MFCTLTILSDILKTRAMAYICRKVFKVCLNIKGLRPELEFAGGSLNSSRFAWIHLVILFQKCIHIFLSDITNANNHLHIFYNKIKKLVLKYWYCDLCRLYVSNIGFVNLA